MVDLSIPLRVVDIAPETFDRAVKDVVPLPVEMVQPGRALPMDLYLPRLQRQQNRVEMVRLLSAGRPPSRRLLKMVREAGLDTFYCHRTQLEQLIEFMGQHTARRLSDHTTPMPVKARLLYDQASLIAEQAMTDVRLGPNLEHGRTYVETMADFIRSSPAALQDLADMLVMDYSLYTHSVNVCLLATSFAVFLGMGGNQVRDLGLSALYHDIGKRGIPEGILKKPGPLDEEEWKIKIGRAHV
jgi:HD-GYP domain-containing protein (c-di-GMP phosphodiesterase class II)